MREIRPLSGRPAGFDFVRPCHPERRGAQAREVELRSSAERSDGRIRADSAQDDAQIRRYNHQVLVVTAYHRLARLFFVLANTLQTPIWRSIFDLSGRLR